MYELYDTFNGRIVSRHRTIENAVKANIRLQRRTKKYNGDSCYIPTQILDRDGDPITSDHPEYEHLWDAEAKLT